MSGTRSDTRFGRRGALCCVSLVLAESRHLPVLTPIFIFESRGERVAVFRPIAEESRSGRGGRRGALTGISACVSDSPWATPVVMVGLISAVLRATATGQAKEGSATLSARRGTGRDHLVAFPRASDGFRCGR